MPDVLFAARFRKITNLANFAIFRKHTKYRKFLQLRSNLDISELITPFHTKFL